MCPAASDKETAQPQTCIHLAPRLRWSHRRGIAYDPLLPAAARTRFRARSKHASRLRACRACRACRCQAVAGASLGGPWRLCLRLGAAWGQMTASRIRPSLGVPARRPAFSISHPPAFVSTSSMSAADCQPPTPSPFTSRATITHALHGQHLLRLTLVPVTPANSAFPQLVARGTKEPVEACLCPSSGRLSLEPACLQDLNACKYPGSSIISFDMCLYRGG